MEDGFRSTQPILRRQLNKSDVGWVEWSETHRWIEKLWPTTEDCKLKVVHIFLLS